MAPNFDWKIDDVDENTKEHFETAVREKIIPSIEIPDKYREEDLEVTVYKNSRGPNKSYSIAGEILGPEKEFIASYQITSNPSGKGIATYRFGKERFLLS